MVTRTRIPACAVLAAVAASGPASAQNGDEEQYLNRSPAACVQVSRIRETEIIDDQTILFYMRGGRVYQNLLDHDCPGLERTGRMAYQARGGRLCDIDTITVLELGGFSGPTCRLGPFHPITREEAERMELGPGDDAVGGGAVVITEVELPQEEAAEGDGVGPPDEAPDDSE